MKLGLKRTGPSLHRGLESTGSVRVCGWGGGGRQKPAFLKNNTCLIHGPKFWTFSSIFCISSLKKYTRNRWKKHIWYDHHKKVTNFLSSQLIMFCSLLLYNLTNIFNFFLSKLTTFCILILDISQLLHI